MAFDISKYLPGYKSNLASAEGNISQLLSGQPSTGPARSKAAYFGATSGMPNSGVSNALGYDLYKQDAAKNQEVGFDQLMKLITGTPGNAFADPSQQFQQDRYQQDFNEQRRLQEQARQDAQNKLTAASRPKLANGMYRLPGGDTPAGTWNVPVLPAWAR